MGGDTFSRNVVDPPKKLSHPLLFWLAGRALRLVKRGGAACGDRTAESRPVLLRSCTCCGGQFRQRLRRLASTAIDRHQRAAPPANPRTLARDAAAKRRAPGQTGRKSRICWWWGSIFTIGRKGSPAANSRHWLPLAAALSRQCSADELSRVLPACRNVSAEA